MAYSRDAFTRDYWRLERDKRERLESKLDELEVAKNS